MTTMNGMTTITGMTADNWDDGMIAMNGMTRITADDEGD